MGPIRYLLALAFLLPACPDAEDIEPCDEDGDGFWKATEACGGGSDCDDTDPDINPEAVEVCDGRDGNCDGVRAMCVCDLDPTRAERGAACGALVWFGELESDGDLICQGWVEHIEGCP